MKLRYTNTLFIFFCLFGFLYTSQAQQIPNFNQDIYNSKFYNPAALGEGFVGIQYRSQFSEFESDIAPRTFAVTADLSSLLNLSEKRIAVGFSLLSNQEHLIEQLKGKFLFAYHLVKNKNNTLSAGIEAGLFSQQLDLNGTLISDPQDAVIYDGSFKKAIFDGGFGLRYQYSSETGQEFNLNLAAAQLFNSDFNYDDSREFDLSPHLTLGASYRFPAGAISLEPHVLFRDIIGEKSLKKGKIDLSLRAHVLNDKLWFGAGTRLEASTYHAGFGVEIVENFSFQGSFETNSLLGSNWEVQLVYTFSDKGDEPGDDRDIRLKDEPGKEPVIEPNEENVNLKTTFSNLDNKTSALAQKAGSAANDAQNQLLSARAFLTEAKKADISKDYLRSRLDNAESNLAQAKTTLERAIDPLRDATQNKKEADELYKTASRNNQTNRKIDKSWGNIKKSVTEAINPIVSTAYDYEQLNKEIQQLKVESGLEAMSLKTMIATKDIAKLKTYYQRALNSAIGISKETSPVVITTDGLGLKLKYKYPHSQFDFKLEDGLSEPRFMANHIIQQIKDLRKQGADINSITIIANMQARSSTLENAITDAEYTEDQFGFKVNVKYQFYDEVNKMIQGENIEIQIGRINLKQLACLKLHGLKRYMGKNGISSTMGPINFEMSAPNYDQSAPEVYEIVIDFK